MSKMIEVRLQEIADELDTLRSAEEACEYALHYIAEVAQALPTNIGMSHHAEMEIEEVHSEITDRIQELEDKIGAI
jgi:prefoldin subunit 5